MYLKKMSSRAVLAVGITLALALPALAAPASAATTAISGATGWGPCTWFTSSNVRSTSAANVNVAAQIDDAGKLGVKMRTKAESSGAIGTTQYFPAGSSYLTFAKYAAKGTKFRLQFTCRNERKGSERPDTDFAGSLRY